MTTPGPQIQYVVTAALGRRQRPRLYRVVRVGPLSPETTIATYYTWEEARSVADVLNAHADGEWTGGTHDAA